MHLHITWGFAWTLASISLVSKLEYDIGAFQIDHFF